MNQPQNWNRYAYVANNPLKYVDPTGEFLELTGSEEDRKKAFERLKQMLGEAGKTLYVVEAQDSKGNTHYYVESTAKDLGAAGAGPLGTFISQIIDSNAGVEFTVANSFNTKFQQGVKTGTGVCGGACTVGAEESLTGNTQIFVHPDAGDIAQERFNTPLNQAYKVKPRGQLDFYNDIVDAHEFGHAYANAIEGLPIRNSNATNPRSLQLENYVRERRGMTKRRTGH